MNEFLQKGISPDLHLKKNMSEFVGHQEHVLYLHRVLLASCPSGPQCKEKRRVALFGHFWLLSPKKMCSWTIPQQM